MALNDAVPSSATDVFKRNAEDADKLLNATGNITTRTGKSLPTWDEIAKSHAAWNNRGAWVTATAYAVNDIWESAGVWYAVLTPYTSGATVDLDISGGNVAVLNGNFGSAATKNTDELVTPISSVADIAGFAGTKDDQQISLKGWHPDSDVGGGILYWDAAKPKSEHNGGTVFSPTVPFSATTGDYLDGIGETDAGGSGCWVGNLSLIKYSDAGIGWNLIQQIRANQRDVNFLVQGDSTGNETYEWVYLTANNLADEFPTHTVNYYLWNVGTADYDSVEVISTGTGSNVINVYNASVSGSSAVYFDGARKEKCFAGKDFDLIINNYGHNGATAADVAGVADRVLIHTTQLMQEQPKAEIVLTLQNIDTSVEAFSARQVQATEYVADMLGLGVIDVRSLFLWAREQGGSLFSSWMGDAVHPSASGQKVWADMVFNMLLNETKQSRRSRIVLNEKLKPVIPNHDFKDWAWDKSSPFGWSVFSATATKDVTDYETGSWSVKLSGTGAGLGTFQVIIDDYLQQRTQGVDLVCMARVKVSESNGSLNAGRVEVVSSISSKASQPYFESYGGWTWGLVTVPADIVDGATTLKVNIYTGDNTDEVLVDRVILLEGNVPYDNYSEKTTLSDYYDPANVGTLEGNTMVVTGNTVEITATTISFPSFYIDVFNLVPNEKYQFEWTTSTPAGTVLIRDGVGGNGTVIETISPLSTQIAAWTAIRGFCTFEVSESLVNTPFSLDDIKITKV